MLRGRPCVFNIKEDKEYFKNYYHNTKEDVICDCGCIINNHSLNKHLKTKKHTNNLVKRNLLKN